MVRPLLLPVALACATAAIIWGRSAMHLNRAWKRITEGAAGSVSADLARSAYRKELHTTLLYSLAAVAFGAASVLVVHGPDARVAIHRAKPPARSWQAGHSPQPNPQA